MTAGAPAARPARPPITRPARAVRWERWGLLLPVLSGVALLALPTLAYPFGPDQAIFAAIGRAINHGGFPYVDAWDQKPPGIYLLYAVALRLPGPFMVKVRLFDLLWTEATVAALYAVALRLWTVRAAACAATLYGLVYFTTQGWWYLAQPDGWTGLPLLLALLLHLTMRGRRAAGAHVAGGVLIGLAFQLRFTVAPIVPAFIALEIWQERRGRRALLGAVLSIGAGFAMALAAVTAWLYWGHALRAMIEATQFAAGYARLGWPGAPPHPTFVMLLNHVRASFLLFVLAHTGLSVPAIAGIFAGGLVLRRPGMPGVALMAVVAYAGIAAQQKFFWYHWQALLPFLALAGGWTWDVMLGWVRRALGGTRAAAATALLITALALATPNVFDYGYAQWDDLLHRSDSRLSRLRYDNAFGGYGDGTFSYLADVQVAAYLRDNTAPGERVYVFGYDPLVYLLSGRESASRFIYALPLMSRWAPARWQEEFLAEIDARRPRYILVQRNEGAARWITGQTEDTAAWAFKLTGVAARLEREYELEVEIEDFALYRRRTP